MRYAPDEVCRQHPVNVNGSTMMIDGAWGDSPAASAESRRCMVQSARDSFYAVLSEGLSLLHRQSNSLLSEISSRNTASTHFETA